VLAAGPDVVYQATFLDGDAAGPMWRVHADFLTKIAGPSSLGAFSYEAEDAKSGRLRFFSYASMPNSWPTYRGESPRRFTS
jgi:hypothetical protein